MARATRDEWAKRVERWKRSGLTAKQFAAREGLRAKSLAWWKWQLGRVTRAAPPVVEVVTLTSEPCAPAPFELMLGDSTRVVVPTSFDADSLRRLLAVLEDR